MEEALILVNGKPFIGRVEEQKQFRAALKEVIHPPKGEDLPYVLLLYGDGGIGKSTLARRFCDIARQETPFEGKVQPLWVDWEEERSRWSSLQVDRKHIHPETVFDVLYTLAARQGWEKDFAAYRQAREERKQAEQAALQALQSGGEREDLAALRGLGAETLAALVRRVLPIGEAGEKLTRAFLETGIQTGAEAAYALRKNIEARLRARLGVRQFDLYLNPHEELARALADGFRRLSQRKALLIVLDTYEIVDRADPWLRLVIRQAGPRILWLLSGRDNLRDSFRDDTGYQRGYSEDFPRRLLAYDLSQLALADVKAYFAARVPQRPLDEEAANAIRRATYGIPLAMAQAAEMWEHGLSLEQIAPAAQEEGLAGEEIVRRMIDRYLLHAVHPEDKRALYALTLARGNLTVLRALLAPADGAPFDLDEALRRLGRDYASVIASKARLHDEAQAFFEQYLRQPLMRQSDTMRGLLRQAEAALRAELKRLAAGLPLLEERALDEDWQRAVLTLTDFLFWQEEERAWEFLLPRYLEALAYNRDLKHALLRLARRWEKDLSARSKRRLTALEDEDSESCLDELTRAAERGWLGGEGAAERHAILDWLRGRLLYDRKRYPEALAAFESAERALPPKGEALREKLANALYTLSGELLWPDDASSAVHHPDAVRVLEKVTAWQPRNQGAWYRLGVALSLAGRNEEALAAFQRAIELDPTDAYPHNGIGNVYSDLKQYDAALAAYRRASELDPKYAAPHNGIGNVYSDLKQYDAALAAHQRAIELDPRYAAPHNGIGNVYYQLGDYDAALAAYQRASELGGLNNHDLAVVHNGIGNVYDDLKQYDAALAAYQRAIELDPKFAAPHNGIGNVYRALGDYNAALAAYQRAIELNPKFAAPHNNIGLVYQLMGEYEKALHACQKAVELAPEEGTYHASLAGVLRKLGREEEAQAQIERARPLIAKENEYNRACFESICGNVDEALRLLKIAIEIKPSRRELARRDPDFDGIREDARFQALLDNC